MGVGRGGHSRRIQDDLLFLNAGIEPKLTRPISLMRMTGKMSLASGNLIASEAPVVKRSAPS